jgi:hypothetical protein
MNKLEEDLIVKEKPHCNWSREKGVYFGDSKTHLVNVHNATATCDINTLTYTSIEEATSDDVELSGLREAIENGSTEQIIQYLKVTYRSPRIGGSRSIQPEDLSVVSRCVLVCERLWIPISRREEASDILHMGHHGVDHMIQRAARGTCYWPGMRRSLELKRTTCEYCCKNAPSSPKTSKIE